MTSVRRIAVVGSVALVGMAVLGGCSSTSSSPSSVMTSASASSSPHMLPPVIIDNTQETATAKVGDSLDILLSDNDIGGTTVSTDRPDLVELTQAHEDGSAIFNPGGKALAPGTATITVTYPDGHTRAITVTITQ